MAEPLGLGGGEQRFKAPQGRILVLDQAEVRAGQIDAYRDSCLNTYKPAAARRGMTLEAIWMAPPVVLDSGCNTLFLLWSFPDLAAFWRARFADVETKAEWWRSTAQLVVSRRRTFLTDVMNQYDVHTSVSD